MAETPTIPNSNASCCPACGAAIAPGHRFCENCGAPAPVPQPAAAPQPAPVASAEIPYAAPVSGPANPQVQQGYSPAAASSVQSPSGPSGMSIVSLVLGIVGILFSFIILGIIPGIVAIILAIIARKKQKSGVAIAGLVTGIVSVVISALMIVLLVVVINAAESFSDYDYDFGEFPSDYESINPVTQTGSEIIGSWDISYAEKKGVAVISEENIKDYDGNFVLTLNEDGSFVMTTPDGDYTGSWYDFSDGSGYLMTDDEDGFYDISYDKSQVILEDTFNEEKLIFNKA